MPLRGRDGCILISMLQTRQERRFSLRKKTFIAALLALGLGAVLIAGTAGAPPAPGTDCDPTFGNTDIFSAAVGDPSP